MSLIVDSWFLRILKIVFVWARVVVAEGRFDGSIWRRYRMKSEESSVNWSWRGGGGCSEDWKGMSFSNPAYNRTPNYHISVLAVTFSFNLYV